MKEALYRKHPKLYDIFYGDIFFKGESDFVEERTPEGGEILIVGCGTGEHSKILEEKGFEVTGVDIDPSRIEEFVEAYDLTIKECDIERQSLPFNDNSISYIIFSEVLEHLRINPLHALREIERVLHPEGKLLLTTPNLYCAYKIAYYLIGRGLDDPVQEWQKVETLGHAGHIRIYSPYEVNKLLNFCGLDVIKNSYHRFGNDIGDHVPILRWLFRGCYRIIPKLRQTQLFLSTPNYS